MVSPLFPCVRRLIYHLRHVTNNIATTCFDERQRLHLPRRGTLAISGLVLVCFQNSARCTLSPLPSHDTPAHHQYHHSPHNDRPTTINSLDDHADVMRISVPYHPTTSNHCQRATLQTMTRPNQVSHPPPRDPIHTDDPDPLGAALRLNVDHHHHYPSQQTTWPHHPTRQSSRVPSPHIYQPRHPPATITIQLRHCAISRQLNRDTCAISRPHAAGTRNTSTRILHPSRH